MMAKTDWRVAQDRNWSNGIERRVHMANPTERSWARQAYVFAFGAYGDTYVMAYGGLEDALEAAAEWLAENAPGHLMAAWGPEHTELVREACIERGLAWPPPTGADLDFVKGVR